MKTLKMVPDKWACTLEECPAGFFTADDELCLKTEYSATLNKVEGQVEAYCCTGEVFWGGTSDIAVRAKIIVQPVVAQWEDE